MTADCIFVQTTSQYTFTVIAADDCSGCVLSEREVLNPIMSLLICTMRLVKRDGHEASDANRKRPCFEKVKCITLETEHEIVFNVKNIFISLGSEEV